jgi:hypothetical protein
MDEPGWITFYTAAHLLREQGKGWAEACKLLRAACRDEDITSMAAPDDEPAGVLPIEYWRRIAPSEWKEREVDYDSPDADGCLTVVMLKEDDFNRWRSKLAMPTKPSRKSRQLELVKHALAALDLPAHLSYPEAEQRVAEWFKQQGISRVPARSTIIRAIKAMT